MASDLRCGLRAREDGELAELLRGDKFLRGLLFRQQIKLRLVGGDTFVGGAGVDLLLHQRSQHPPGQIALQLMPVVALQLEYHLTRLSTSLEDHAHLAIRTRLYTHLNRAELLAQVDTLLAQLDQTRTLAVLAREALLRPQKSEERPGFTD